MAHTSDLQRKYSGLVEGLAAATRVNEEEVTRVLEALGLSVLDSQVEQSLRADVSEFNARDLRLAVRVGNLLVAA